MWRGAASSSLNSRKLGIPAGTYTLTISKTGYYTKTMTGFVVNCNRTGFMHYLVKK